MSGEKEIDCAHYEGFKWVGHHEVGTCRYCGQVKRYPWDGHGNVVILKKGDPEKARPREETVKALKEQIPIPEEKPIIEQIKEEELIVDKEIPKKPGGVVTWESSRYYEKHKEAIISDLLAYGTVRTRERWSIPGSTMSTLINVKWELPEKTKLAIVRATKKNKAFVKKARAATVKEKPETIEVKEEEIKPEPEEEEEELEVRLEKAIFDYKQIRNRLKFPPGLLVSIKTTSIKLPAFPEFNEAWPDELKREWIRCYTIMKERGAWC